MLSRCKVLVGFGHDLIIRESLKADDPSLRTVASRWRNCFESSETDASWFVKIEAAPGNVSLTLSAWVEAPLAN